ncbi:YecA family protein [Leifsonia sp. Leaf264]|uniref:YecA family protein n=1 Tax=Leifsonia sp. Leaf264 TaxID=1736314 RepID=UPI0012F76179|nr:SEC-C domain-containing protein [Leifsonia sp. Leaf264]
MLDVLDEFSVLRGDLDFATMPGRAIHELGEKIRSYAEEATPALEESAHPVYIGGWPSASFWAVEGDLILSNLLYSGQVLVRDPLADWFSDDQYFIEHMIPSRPGYRDSSDGYAIRMDRTRAFLCTVVPELYRLRPLIDAGIIVMTPAESVHRRRSPEVEALTGLLESAVGSDFTAYAKKFGPADIATEGNVRGLFVFAPSLEPEEQIRRAMRHGFRYFAREYIFANEYGATYVAPFDHERHLCREGVAQIAGPSTAVSQALLQSELPIFAGLTPFLISKIHDDDAFGEFRSELHGLYQNAPLNSSSAELGAYVRDQERTLLAPILRRTEGALDQGFLRRAGAAVTSAKYTVAAGLISDVVFQTGGLGVLLGAGGAIADGYSENSGKPGTKRIWSALVRHGRTVQSELSGRLKVAEGSGWPGATEPSMQVQITAGMLLGDFPIPVKEIEGYQQGDYRPCPCGSGRRYKFCCAGLERVRGLTP